MRYVVALVLMVLMVLVCLVAVATAMVQWKMVIANSRDSRIVAHSPLESHMGTTLIRKRNGN